MMCSIELTDDSNTEIQEESEREEEEEEEEEVGNSTDDSSCPLRGHHPLGEKEENARTAGPGEKKVKTKTAAPGENKKTKTDQTGEEAKLTHKDVKNAPSTSQFLIRTSFFAAAAFFFFVLVQQRPTPPVLLAGNPSIKHKLQVEFTVEITLALSVMTALHFALLASEFVYTRAPRIRGGYAAIGPISLAIFVCSWMVTYTIHMPFSYKRRWHWFMTICFIVINLVVGCIVGFRGWKIEDDKIVEV